MREPRGRGRCPAVPRPEGSSTRSRSRRNTQREIRESEREEEEDGNGGTEKQRRRDLSSATTVQQPFVVGRGEKFAFFVIFFLLGASLPSRLSLRRSTDFFTVLSVFQERSPRTHATAIEYFAK